MAADDGRGSQRGERQSAGSARGNSNTNNSARGDARESRSQESSRSGSGSGVGTNAPSRGTGGNTGPSRSSGASDRNNGQSGARESRGVTAGSVGAVGRENDRSIGRGLAGAAGLAGASLGGNVTSTYQGRPSSVASAALSRQSLAPDRAMPTGPVRGNMPSSVTPSFRVSENLSMSKLANMRAPSFRATEEKSMQDLGNYERSVVSVLAAGPGWTTVQYGNGTVETRKGDRASRNNNPGNIEAGKFAKSVGAVGTDGRFAVFGSKEEGLKAMSSLLGTSRYANKTVREAIHTYAPPNENNSNAYAAAAARAAGVDVDAPMSSLSPAQRQSMVQGMTKVEGNTGYASNVTTSRPSYGYGPAGDKPAPRAASFADKYLGAARPAGPVSDNLPASQRTQQPSRELMSDQEQQSVYGEEPGGYAVGQPLSQRQVAQQSPTVGSPVSPTYSARAVAPTPNIPAPVSTVPSTSVPAVKATPVAPATETPVKAPLTTTQKVVAGAIDVGTGIIPGVGLAATVYNGLASLTGQPTIGGMAVDLLGGGSNLGTGGPRRNEESGRRSNYEPPEPKEPETTIKKPPEVERFRERYLIPTIDRPTPAEKWGRRRPT